MPRLVGLGPIRIEKNIYIPIPAGTGAVEAITDWVAGYRYTIESVKASWQIAATGASASRVFRVVKGASTVVATATILLADGDTVGKEKVFTVTAANASFGDADTLTVDFPTAGAVAFTAGAVNLTIVYRQSPQRVAD
jgi:hypothetical protein